MTLMGPAMSFGGPAIDGRGSTWRLPGQSMLTGLIGNALGVEREDFQKLSDIQSSIVFAAREDRAGSLMEDFQTANLSHKDAAWTRFGVETRGGAEYEGQVVSYRPFLADHAVTVVVASKDDPEWADQLVSAFERPARPLFLGRKGFFPSRPILDRNRPIFVEAETARRAIIAVQPIDGPGEMLACWPFDGESVGRKVRLHDRREWRSNRHAGESKRMEGRVTVGAV